MSQKRKIPGPHQLRFLHCAAKAARRYGFSTLHNFKNISTDTFLRLTRVYLSDSFNSLTFSGCVIGVFCYIQFIIRARVDFIKRKREKEVLFLTTRARIAMHGIEKYFLPARLCSSFKDRRFDRCTNAAETGWIKRTEEEME